MGIPKLSLAGLHPEYSRRTSYTVLSPNKTERNNGTAPTQPTPKHLLSDTYRKGTKLSSWGTLDCVLKPGFSYTVDEVHCSHLATQGCGQPPDLVAAPDEATKPLHKQPTVRTRSPCVNQRANPTPSLPSTSNLQVGDFCSAHLSWSAVRISPHAPGVPDQTTRRPPPLCEHALSQLQGARGSRARVWAQRARSLP